MMERLKKFFAAPTFDNEADNRTAYLLNFISWVYLALAIFTTLSSLAIFAEQISSNLLRSTLSVSVRVVPLLAANILAQILMRLGRVRIASYVFIGLLWLGQAVALIFNSDINSASYAFFFIPILLAGLLLGARATSLLTFLSITVGVITLILDSQGLLPGPISGQPSSPLSGYIILSFSFLIATAVLYLFINQLNNAIQRTQIANEKLQQSSQVLEIGIQERTRDLSIAAEIGRSLSQVFNVEDLLILASSVIRDRFELYYTQIYLVDESGSDLILRAGTGSVGRELMARHHQLPLNAGSINGAAAVNREPVIVADTEQSAFFRPNLLLPETRSEMAVPLIASDKVVGVIDLQSTQPNALSIDNLPPFEILAGQLAIAIENARLVQDSNRIRQELEMQLRSTVKGDWDRYLNAIDKGEYLGFQFDKGQIKTVTRQESTETGEHHVSLPIALAGETIGTIDLAGEESALSAEDLALVSSVAHQVSQQLENLRLLDEADRYRREAEEASRRLIREGWEDLNKVEDLSGFKYDHEQVSLLTGTEENTATTEVGQVPLTVQGEAIGHLETVGSTKGYALLTAVADRLSAHIENLRLSKQTEIALAVSEQRAKELAILNEMSRELSSQIDVDAILETIYNYTSQLMDTTNFYVALYHKATNEIEFALNVRDSQLHWHQETRPLGQGITEYILKSREPLLMPNNVVEHLTQLGIEQIGNAAESWLGVPLVAGSEEIGVIGLQSYTTPNAYSEQHRTLLQAVASQAAIAIESARLFAQIQGRARQEQILREVTARVHAAVDAEAILRTAAQEINQRLGVETFVFLENQQAPETANGDNGHQ